MGKRKSAALIDSDDSRSSDSDSGSDIDKDMLSLSKKKGKESVKEIEKKLKVEAFTSSSSSSSGSESDCSKGNKAKKPAAKRSRRSASGTTRSSVSEDEKGSVHASDHSDAENARLVPQTSSSVVSSSVADVKLKTASDLEEGEVSDDDEEFWDGYDENMMGDADDQRRLNAMTEKEREQEIYMRIEKRDCLRTRFETEKKLRMKKKLEASLVKRGKRIEDLVNEDGSGEPFQMDVKVRSQERKKTVEGKVDKKTQAMDALKASRDAKIQRQHEKEEKIKKEQDRRRENRDRDDDDLDLKRDSDAASSVGGDKRAKKLKASDVYSDDSGSDYEDDNKKIKQEKDNLASDSDSRSSDSEDDERNKKPQFVETMDDLTRMRLSRFKLERWVFLPFFKRVVKGCYVRVGVTPTGGQKATYRIFEIDDVGEQLKPYLVGNTKTDKVLLLKTPGEEKGKKFRFEYISNQSFTQQEFEYWKTRMELNQVAFPTLDDVAKKEKEVKEAMEYQLQEDDVTAIIHEKAKFKNAPVNFAARKTQLMKEKEIAQMNGEDELVNELTQQIQGLDERATELDKQRTSTISNISYINERNRKRNVEEAEKAILEELKLNKGKKVEDPFTRRTTKPRIVSKSVLVTNGVDLFKNENGSESLENTKLANLTIDETDSMKNLEENDEDGRKDASVGDLFSAHDFDIKLDLDAKLPPNLPIVARPSIAPIKDSAPRRSLNLEEYKRKKGLI